MSWNIINERNLKIVFKDMINKKFLEIKGDIETIFKKISKIEESLSCLEYKIMRLKA